VSLLQSALIRRTKNETIDYRIPSSADLAITVTFDRLSDDLYALVFRVACS